MNRIRCGRLLVVMLAMAFCGAMPAFLIGQAAPSGAQRPATRPGTATTAPRTIAYYDAACRRCHGPEGSFYGPELGRHLTDAQLIKVIDDMARGPANEPLDEAGLAAQTAYHRAIIAGAPYISVTAIDGNQLEGEVMTEATVSLQGDGLPAPLAATVTESSWKLALPAGVRREGLTLVARRAGKETRLPLSSAVLHSHATPGGSGGATMPAGAAASQRGR